MVFVPRLTGLCVGGERAWSDHRTVGLIGARVQGGICAASRFLQVVVHEAWYRSADRADQAAAG